MKVLVIGSGGREHALAWKIARSASVEQVIGAPGNPGIASLDKGLCVPVDGMDFAAVKALIEDKDIGLTVVGPEAPLAEGLVDYLSEGGDLVFGPCRQAAQLEGSKAFAKAFMRRHNIPTADYAVFDSAEEAERHVRENGAPIVVKADGLAAGKGVTVAMTEEEAVAAIREAMIGGVFGDAGRRVVLEEFMTGEEASILAFCDGETVVPMASSQDHKPALDGDKGPNTGGMGAYSPAPVVDDETARRVYDEILLPCVRGMAAEGAPYKGVLYAGIMVTDRGPRVVEFNVRFGDPETQVVLPRMTSDIVPVLVACARGGLAEPQLPFGTCQKREQAAGNRAAQMPKVINIRAGSKPDGDVQEEDKHQVAQHRAGARAKKLPVLQDEQDLRREQPENARGRAQRVVR